MLAKLFPNWNVNIMYALFALLFAFEMVGVFNKHFVTITAIIRAYVPMWARAMILGWLSWHFLLAKGNA